MGGGTEAFPELGMHCQHPECNQLDFLPFKCDSCLKVYCKDHRLYKSHECPKSDQNSRKVLVCEICSTSIETTGHDEKTILESHDRSGDCDPKKKKKPTCPVPRCREKLTFSNTSTCKTCKVKVCLKHRFAADHGCDGRSSSVAYPARDGSKFLAALASRNVSACAKNGRVGGSASPPSTPLRAF